MSTANTSLRVTELDFDTIKNNLKNYLKSQSEFQDFDFDGSGMSVLLDILAYNTHYMGFYLNMIGNEMFLDTSQIRSSILSHAKAINYVPTSKQGSQSLLNILVTPSDTESTSVNSLTIDRYTKFLGQDIDGVNYPFVATSSNTVLKSGSTFSFSNVNIKQGEVITLQYEMTPTNTYRRFEIPSQNVDTTTISITVQESSTNTDTRVYLPTTDITTLTSSSLSYFIEENENQNYTFYFGDDIIGKKPKNGNIITCTYIDNNGSLSNNISRFIATDAIGGLYRNNVQITTVKSSFGGIDKETIEQVRFRAPYYYATQNRAVTTNDYRTLLTKDFSNIESVSVWGGEDNDPIVYGKVFLSLKTRQNIALTNVDKEFIKDTLIRNRNVVTVTPEIVDPDFAYIRVLAKVSYNPYLTSLGVNQLAEVVKASIFDYNDRELNTFDSTFRKSMLSRYMETSDRSILGTDITIFVQKRVTLNTINSKKYDINFNMPLRKGNYANKLFSFPEIYINDSNTVERKVLFEEVLDAPTGINSIEITNGGLSYSTAPNVVIEGDGTGAIARAYVADGKVYKIEILNKGVDYTKATVSFTSDTGINATAIVQLENNFGTIRSFYYNEKGEKITINANVGSINYLTGLVTVGPFKTAGNVENDFYADDIVTFYAPVENEIILPLRNRILTIDEGDSRSVIIDMIAEQ
jgi:hypothetical protein